MFWVYLSTDTERIQRLASSSLTKLSKRSGSCHRSVFFTVTDVNDILEGSLPRVARWPSRGTARELHGGRDRGFLAWQPNQFAPAAEGCPVCSTSRGQPPTWCDLWRCREMITKLHFEGVRRGIPGPTPSTGNNPTTGSGVSPRHPGRRLPPNFYMTGTNPRTGRHWTAFLCPVIRRRRRHCRIPTGEK